MHQQSLQFAVRKNKRVLARWTTFQTYADEKTIHQLDSSLEYF